MKANIKRKYINGPKCLPWKDEERVWYVRKHVDKSLIVLPMGIWYMGYLNIITSNKLVMYLLIVPILNQTKERTYPQIQKNSKGQIINTSVTI